MMFQQQMFQISSGRKNIQILHSQHPHCKLIFKLIFTETPTGYLGGPHMENCARFWDAQCKKDEDERDRSSGVLEVE